MDKPKSDELNNQQMQGLPDVDLGDWVDQQLNIEPNQSFGFPEHLSDDLSLSNLFEENQLIEFSTELQRRFGNPERTPLLTLEDAIALAESQANTEINEIAHVTDQGTGVGSRRHLDFGQTNNVQSNYFHSRLNINSSTPRPNHWIVCNQRPQFPVNPLGNLRFGGTNFVPNQSLTDNRIIHQNEMMFPSESEVQPRQLLFPVSQFGDPSFGDTYFVPNLSLTDNNIILQNETVLPSENEVQPSPSLFPVNQFGDLRFGDTNFVPNQSLTDNRIIHQNEMVLPSENEVQPVQSLFPVHQLGDTNFVATPSVTDNKITKDEMVMPSENEVEPSQSESVADNAGKDSNEDNTQNRRDELKPAEERRCKSCKCKKSKCLKLYCECFAAKVYCTEPCGCTNCFNKPVNKDMIAEIRTNRTNNNPFAFVPKVIKKSTVTHQLENGETRSVTEHIRGCKCIKSNCAKKYCECFLVGVGCSKVCKCQGCMNTYGRKEPLAENAEKPSEEVDIEKAALPSSPSSKGKALLNVDNGSQSTTFEVGGPSNASNKDDSDDDFPEPSVQTSPKRHRGSSSPRGGREL